MTFLGYFLITYFSSLLLKLLGVPPFNGMSWAWWILTPIIVPIAKILYEIAAFVFSAAVGFGVIWLVCKFFIYSMK